MTASNESRGVGTLRGLALRQLGDVFPNSKRGRQSRRLYPQQVHKARHAVDRRTLDREIRRTHKPARLTYVVDVFPS